MVEYKIETSIHIYIKKSLQIPCGYVYNHRRNKILQSDKKYYDKKTTQITVKYFNWKKLGGIYTSFFLYSDVTKYGRNESIIDED